MSIQDLYTAQISILICDLSPSTYLANKEGGLAITNIISQEGEIYEYTMQMHTTIP